MLDRLEVGERSGEGEGVGSRKYDHFIAEIGREVLNSGKGKEKEKQS